MNFKNKTYVITGASRGIGREIALRLAREGANIVIASKTSEPHPTLPGTIHSVAEEVKEAGGDSLALVLDVRDADAVTATMDKAASHFGAIDGVINNAGAIYLAGTESTPAKRFDLMHAVNTRGTFLCAQAAIPHLRKNGGGHILNLSPLSTCSPSGSLHMSPTPSLNSA